MLDARIQHQDESTDLYDTIGDKFCHVISSIDEDAFGGTERDLALCLPSSLAPGLAPSAIRHGDAERALVGRDTRRPAKKAQTQDKSVNVFSKVDLYMNSRLPNSLPPLRLYLPTYPLLCLAAQYSACAYSSPRLRSEKKDFISGRRGSKAMVIKSIPCDDQKTLVFAIRGTSTLSVRDWGVNLQTEPTSPTGFLDDEGNLCHSGFLEVARAMIKPVAERLRSLLEENPSRCACSLLITGHSAGGAVASLLYSHMLAETVQSELNILTGCFKRIHCITFGAPPVTLLPLQHPGGADSRFRKCLFHSFMNEGDPVVRAERAYVRSLIDLLAAPTPAVVASSAAPTFTGLGLSMSQLDLSPKAMKKSKSKTSTPPPRTLWWPVPQGTLSNAGRLIVLRVPDGKPETDVTANIVSDEQLRHAIFGNPLMHTMDLYASRIETLAVRAVTGKGDGC